MMTTLRYSHAVAAVLFAMFDIAYPGNNACTADQFINAYRGKRSAAKTVFHKLYMMKLIVLVESSDDGRWEWTKPLKQHVKAWRRGEHKRPLHAALVSPAALFGGWTAGLPHYSESESQAERVHE